MDFFELLKQGQYIIDIGNEFLWDCWPNTHIITLTPEDDYNIIISYDTKTLHVHSMEISMFINDGTFLGLNKTFKWFDPDSKKLFLADSNYVDYRDGLITIIDDEEEMDFITLKLKYT